MYLLLLRIYDFFTRISLTISYSQSITFAVTDPRRKYRSRPFATLRPINYRVVIVALDSLYVSLMRITLFVKARRKTAARDKRTEHERNVI